MSAQTAFDIKVVSPAPSIDLDPHKLGFGRVFAPLWLASAYENGAWQRSRIEAWSTIDLHPAAIVFHYGQAVFEGLKAYRWEDGSIHLFRPTENARRLNQSVERMAMPAVDENAFVEGIRALVGHQRDWVPKAPGSLYIRPTMIGTEPCIGVRAANEFLYFVLALPSGTYFPVEAGQSGAGSVKVLVSSKVGRAAHGGTGNVKAAANYAVTLKVIGDAKDKDCSQVLFLDAAGEGRVEEMGGMNIFFISGKKLLTPKLNDTILPGVTRDSILKLAPSLGYETEEADIDFTTLAAQLRKGEVSEAFACGTAAVITGIESFLLDSGEKIALRDTAPGPVTAALYERLTGIQYGRYPDPFGWTVKV
jgi:branched-chain amino acid aminotransferase